jgi:hypothetical protein
LRRGSDAFVEALFRVLSPETLILAGLFEKGEELAPKGPGHDLHGKEEPLVGGVPSVI